jgi:hypothetical protein
VRYFQPVSDASTNPPFLWLTSEFRWDLVLSKEYGRQLKDKDKCLMTLYKHSETLHIIISQCRLPVSAPLGLNKYFKQTHQSMTGWISADRRTKSALMLTIPAPNYVVCIRCTTSTRWILNVTKSDKLAIIISFDRYKWKQWKALRSVSVRT